MCKMHFYLNSHFFRVVLLFRKSISEINDSCKHEHELERADACSSGVIFQPVQGIAAKTQIQSTLSWVEPGDRGSWCANGRFYHSYISWVGWFVVGFWGSSFSYVVCCAGWAWDSSCYGVIFKVFHQEIRKSDAAMGPNNNFYSINCLSIMISSCLSSME